MEKQAYSVGTKVRINDHLRSGSVNHDGMDHWCGRVMTVRRHLGGDSYFMVEDYTAEENNGTGWAWNARDFVPFQKVVIATNGATTHARLYNGNKIVKSASSRCHPDDEFNFEIGAALAFSRLLPNAQLPQQPKTELQTQSASCLSKRDWKPKLRSGDLVRVGALATHAIVIGYITDDQSLYHLCELVSLHTGQTMVRDENDLTFIAHIGG